jgi:predicted nucleotidyltransferase
MKVSIKPDRPLSPIILALMREVDTFINRMKLGYFLCGAAARDILLRHVHGIETGIATLDVDFAVAVENWKRFENIKDRLIKTGRFASHKKMAQRLYYRYGTSSEGYPLDIIPFGNLENPPNSIAWPPDGTEVMSVIGYDEALSSTIEVEVDKDFVVPVISLPGLTLLKLFAWSDRGIQNAKDASDLVTLLCNYDAGNEDRLYGEELDLLEAAKFDLAIAGPQLLGKDVRRIAKQNTLAQALGILGDPKLIYRLVNDMAPKLAGHDAVDRAERLLERFKAGLSGQ